MPDIDLSPFLPHHLPAATALSRAAGWPHQTEDWEMLLPFSTGVVAMAEGKVAGTALRSDFGAELSTINMVIVSEEMRSRGLGRALVAALMAEGCRTLRLVATLSGLPLYEKLGFQEAQRLTQHQGIVTAPPEAGLAEAAAPEDRTEIAALEAASFGGDRAAPLAWLWKEGRFAVQRRGAAVTGFAACRRFGRGYVIGPVVAPDRAAAQDLIGFHLRACAGEFVRLDVTRQSGLSPWLIDCGLLLTAMPPLMLRGPSLPSDQRIALFSQALG